MTVLIQVIILTTIISRNTVSGDVFYSKSYGFRRFLNVSLVDHFIIKAKFTGNFNLAFYSSSIRLLGMYLAASKYATIGYPATNFPVPLPSPTEYNLYWFKYGTDRVKFGLGSEPETNILGELPINTNGAVMYVAFCSYQPREVFVKFPDTAKFTDNPGFRLHIASNPTPSLLSVDDVMSCALACLSNNGCYAFNYKRNTQHDNCQSIDAKEVDSVVPFTIVEDTEWSYFYLHSL